MSRAGLRPLVAGNWKMNTDTAAGVALVRAVCDGVAGTPVEVAVLPPFTHLAAVKEAAAGRLRVGAQNCFYEDAGAYTGEVSPVMLLGLCDHVLVGHSERRHILGEDDETVARKLVRAHAHGFTVMLAVGETEMEREEGQTRGVIDRQLDSALRGVQGLGGDDLVVAYEPVWAIGTGRTATPEQAEEVCAHIAQRLHDLLGDAGDSVRVLYGGSVTAENATELFAQPHIDGALVGGASLKPDAFSTIVRAAEARAGSTRPGA